MTPVILSVILPNFNHGAFVGIALDALMSQERPPDEIIVVDDCSTDNSIDVLERYLETFPTLVLLRNEQNIGAIKTLQRGLEAARGRYVYFAAADDYVLPGFFADAIACLESNPSCGLCSGEAIIVDGITGKPVGLRPPVRPRQFGGMVSPEETRELLTTNDNFILTGSAIFRRDAVMDKGGFDVRAGSFADGLLCRKIALTRGFFFRPTVYAVWNVFEQGLSRSTALELQRARRALSEIPALIRADADFPEDYAARFERRWRFATARLSVQQGKEGLNALLEMGGGSPAVDKRLRGLSKLSRFRLGRLLTLAYLALRFRPYSITALALTALLRLNVAARVTPKLRHSKEA